MSLTQKTLIVLCSSIILLAAISARDNLKILKFDQSGYHLYLPAIFIYQDLGQLRFYKDIDARYQPSDDGHDYGLYAQANGKKLNKYPPGVAIAELPFFLIAHAFASASEYYAQDGYSPPYQLAVALSTLWWGIVGLWALAAFLRRYFSDRHTAASLILIAAGTNLAVYLLLERGMSHPLIFMQTSLILLCCDSWYKHKKTVHIAALGLLLGWALITRPTSALLILLPIFWPHPQKIQLWYAHRRQVALGALGYMAVVSLLLGYWKYTTGNWIHFAYEEEGFDFAHSHIREGLFSYRKGWFLYTPLALFGVAGLFLSPPALRRLSLRFAIFLLLSIYIVFSWHDWSYGWSFGCRPMIDILPLIAFGLAACLQRLDALSRIQRIVWTGVGALLLCLNIYQSVQFKYGVLPGERITKAYYWRVWNKMSVSDEDRKYLEH